MKRILQKEDVAKALVNLTAEKGKKPTIAALHAALGNRGSLSTLIQLVAEIEAAQRPATEAGDAFNSFREIWALAMDEGQKQAEAKIKELTAIQYTLCQENERLDGAAIAAQERLATLEKEKSDLALECSQAKAKLENQLNQAQTALAEANGRTTQAFERLSALQSAHATELAALHADRDVAIKAQHAAEIALAACKARLESK